MRSVTDMKLNINGDGLADYLVVDRANGAVNAWVNGGAGPSGSTWVWIDQGVIATGVGANGLAIHFADVDGDKHVDYLELNPATAAVVAWLSGCGVVRDNPGTEKRQGPVGPLTPSSSCDDLQGKCPSIGCSGLSKSLLQYMSLNLDQYFLR